jgi:hypothetical protein
LTLSYILYMQTNGCSRFGEEEDDLCDDVALQTMVGASAAITRW